MLRTFTTIARSCLLDIISNTFLIMRRKLSVVAILLVVFGFGMVHSPSVLMERIAIVLMGVGIIYLIYMLIVTRPKDDPDTQQ